MRGLVVTFLIAIAVLLQGCGAAPQTNSGTGTGSTVTTGQHLYAGACDILGTPFGGGAGLVGDPYMICNVTHLYNTSQPGNGAKSYVLMKDLELSGAPLFAISDFTGTFEGNGYILNKLTDSVLFNNNAGTINNVTITNAAISGSYQSGILVGWNQVGGVVSNSHVSGVVLTGYTTGGLVGRNEGTITKSSANVVLQGYDTLGGLVGLNKGTITKSSSHGSVVGSNSKRGLIGGFVADNYSGTITDCYSSASAQGSSNVGGFFGQNEATIVNAFSTGVVASTGINLGGFGGLNTGTVTSSYFDSQTSGIGTSSGGVATTTSAMQSQSTFVGWDFAGSWVMVNYPSLR